MSQFDQNNEKDHTDEASLNYSNENTITTKPSVPAKQETNHQKFLPKNFLSFASKSKLKKATHESTNASNTSSTTSVNSVFTNNYIDDLNTSQLLSSSPNQHHIDKHSPSMIGSYQVDFEKLARELILPSLDAPLTSFKTNNLTTKHPLQTSKTIDSDKPNSKK